MRREIPAAVLAIALALPAGAEEFDFFTIGAGQLGGGYYAAATAICTVIHTLRPGELRCSPDPSPGSVYNVVALSQGQLDFALVQSDTHFFAVTGTGAFAASGPDASLRSVLSLYPEPLTLLVRRDAGVNRPTDLAGKRANLGLRNSGTRATTIRLMEALGFDEDFFGEVRSLPTGAAVEQLCAGDLDAVFLVIGHPNATIAKALRDCDIALAPMSGPQIDDHVASNPEYSPSVISRGTYPELTRDIPTFSVTATLMTRADVPAELVSDVTRIIVENLPALNRRAAVIPAEASPGLSTDGLSAPLHEGAAAVFADR
jgi:TRAP transporter TAXI family solute receptor